jgi:hypothetical protein
VSVDAALQAPSALLHPFHRNYQLNTLKDFADEDKLITYKTGFAVTR